MSIAMTRQNLKYYRSYQVGDVVWEDYQYDGRALVRWAVKIVKRVDSDEEMNFIVTALYKEILSGTDTFMGVGDESLWYFDQTNDRLCDKDCIGCKIRFVCLTTFRGVSEDELYEDR